MRAHPWCEGEGTEQFVRRGPRLVAPAALVIAAAGMLPNAAGAVAAPVPGPSVLSAGSSLGIGGTLDAPGGGFRLTLQSDGNLVDRSATGEVRWSTGTQGRGVRQVTVTSQGRFELTGAAGSVVWRAQSPRAEGAVLTLERDGDLVLSSSGGLPLWTSALGGPTGNTPSSMVAGSQMGVTDDLLSPDGSYQASLAGGVLGVHGPAGSTGWTSPVTAEPATELRSLPRGPLELLDGAGGVVWSIPTARDPGEQLALTNGGVLEVTSPGGLVLWSDGVLTHNGDDHLAFGESLGVGQFLSARGGQRAVLQGDGNFVVYGSLGQVRWSTGTEGSGADELAMQSDGNLVLYRSGGHAVWSSLTAPHRNAALRLEPSGSIEIATPARPLWVDGVAQTLFGTTIGIDPGHNGLNFSDPSFIDAPIWNGHNVESCDTTGTQTADGFTEAQYNFDLAFALAGDLTAAGAHVVLTRTSNEGVGPCVTTRAQILNDAHVDVAIDIHADGGPIDGRGFAVLEPVPDGPNDAVVASSDAFGSDLVTAFEQTGMPPSTYDGVGGIDQRDDLAGLNLTTVPKVLIETGNMVNPTDAAMLESGSFRNAAAAAIRSAMTKFLGR